MTKTVRGRLLIILFICAATACLAVMVYAVSYVVVAHPSVSIAEVHRLADVITAWVVQSFAIIVCIAVAARAIFWLVRGK